MKKLFEKHPWFKLKRYCHIGIPLEVVDFHWIKKYVENPPKIISHAFLPLIYRQIKQRKFRVSKDDKGNRSNWRKSDTKERHIYYATHLDSMVYRYYAFKLRDLYEKWLINKDLSDCVTAYRTIPLNSDSKTNKNSIHFAKETFEFIKDFKSDDYRVMAIDISNFFDSLNHKKLKKRWSSLYGMTTLPDDDYNLYKSLTNVSFINEIQIFNEFKNEIWVEDNSGIRKRRKISRRKYLYDNDAIAFCSRDEFEDRILKKGLVHLKRYEKNNDGVEFKITKGIPQGTPISAILANIYMMEFDDKINSLIKEIGGLYRRYSDDMLIVCKSEDLELIHKEICKILKDELLEIQDKKTQIFRFYRNCSVLKCEEYIKKFKTWNPNKNLTYLGFDFDGDVVLLKDAGLSKYQRKMKKSVWRAGRFASKGKNKENYIRVFKMIN